MKDRGRRVAVYKMLLDIVFKDGHLEVFLRISYLSRFLSSTHYRSLRFSRTYFWRDQGSELEDESVKRERV